MSIKPILFLYEGCSSDGEEKKYQHQKPGWGSLQTALDRLPPTPVPISFFFSDTENKFIGLIL